MIEPVLYFLLGFLTSGLLALMIAPAIWSRAVRLTRRRIEASQPLTLAEIKADRDQLRADFAVTSRRLELNISDLRTKSANQRIEVSRTLSERDEAVAEKQRMAADLRVYESELSSRGVGISQLQEEIRTLQSDVDQRQQIISAMELRIRELNAEIDGGKLEIAALNARLEASGSQSDSLSESRRLAEVRIVNLTNEIDRRGSVIAEERDRAERLLAEIANLKKVGRLPMPQSAMLSQLGSTIDRDDNERPAISRLETENASLETRLREVSDERDKLSFDLQAAKVRDLTVPADAGDIAILKDRLGDIAARIAHMTAERDGPQGPVDVLVANAPRAPQPANSPGPDDWSANGSMPKRFDTLAEKIQALREAAANE